MKAVGAATSGEGFDPKEPRGRLVAAEDTIAAIATAVAPGQGSVAIVRLSGPRAEAIGRRLFQAPGQQEWASHRVLYGHVVEPKSGERLDEALLLLMRAPRSFTREDVVELHCHGGLVAVRRVLKAVLDAGARLAAPGEFSQRAFLNGRLDLTRAEAIAEMIGARGQRAAQLAMAGLEGGLQRRITALRERLIVGRPNVGKSTLLNRLSRQDRAIVTDLPGTTRDLLESELVLEGVPLTLVDTAGIHATDDLVEQLGIGRSQAALAAADAVLLVFDVASGWGPADQRVRELVPAGVPLLLVGNQCDRCGLAAGAVEAGAPAQVLISALNGDGETELGQMLLQSCGASASEGLQVALNDRQRQLAAGAAESLQRSLEAAADGLPWDFWTIDLAAAAATLGEITGETVTEAVLDRVFSRFCIGK
ncbi:MAG: tRNA modification GTPase [Cyanobium sp. 49614_E6]|nr:tRNA modification GTPase [Cyanobium sp. 49614_E6]